MQTGVSATALRVCALVNVSAEGRAGAFFSKLRRHPHSAVSMELSLKTGWHQAKNRAFRRCKPSSAYCIPTHFTIKHLLGRCWRPHYAFFAHILKKIKSKTSILQCQLIFLHLLVVFSLWEFCRGAHLGNKNSSAKLHGSLSHILKGLAESWKCLSVTMRGCGNKELFAGPTLKQNQRPFIDSLLSLGLQQNVFSAKSHVDETRKQKGSTEEH